MVTYGARASVLQIYSSYIKNTCTHYITNRWRWRNTNIVLIRTELELRCVRAGDLLRGAGEMSSGRHCKQKRLTLP